MTWRVILKAAALFIVLNILFALTDPIPVIGKLTIYNWLIPGRERLPYGENPDSYNLSLYNLDAMFSSHELNQPKRDDEYRVLVLGDSSVWGVLLRPETTLTGYLNAADLRVDGRRLRAYNLGHPVMSVTKDLLLLDYAMHYQPDAILLLITLESLPYSEQLDPPLLQNNAAAVRDLIARYDLALDPDDSRFYTPDFFGRTIVGQRRALADWWRLQLYGFAWANTAIDQIYPDYTPRSNDFEADIRWKDFNEPVDFTEADLALDVIAAGHTIAGDVPLLLVNEPIYIADGTNSDLRYNFWYPRWAYDNYRELMTATATNNNWNYRDLWDSIAPDEFTDSPVHLTPRGSLQLSELLKDFYGRDDHP